MFCSKCGANIPDQAQMCPRCGTRSAAPQPSTPPPQPGRTTAAPAPAPSRSYVGPQKSDGKAIASLILGMLSIFPLWILAGIPAVILGHLSRKSIRESMGRLKGDGMAMAGLIMGYLSMASTPIVLIIAAIAIPSLLRARMMANESTAVRDVRMIVTAEVVYNETYPAAGYASSLAVLGRGQPPVDCTASGSRTAEHACFLDNAMGCATGAWCSKNGYQFNVTATCEAGGACTDFVVTAVPVQPGTTGIKSFCSTSEGVIRVSSLRPVSAPTPAECGTWNRRDGIPLS